MQASSLSGAAASEVYRTAADLAEKLRNKPAEINSLLTIEIEVPHPRRLMRWIGSTVPGQVTASGWRMRGPGAGGIRALALDFMGRLCFDTHEMSRNSDGMFVMERGKLLQSRQLEDLSVSVGVLAELDWLSIQLA